MKNEIVVGLDDSLSGKCRSAMGGAAGEKHRRSVASCARARLALRC